MNSLWLIILAICFLCLFLFLREKVESYQFDPNRNSPEQTKYRAKLRRKLLERFFVTSPKLTLRIYQSLTGLDLTQARAELSTFVQEGWLHMVGEGADVVYYNFKSSYQAENIKKIINQG